MLKLENVDFSYADKKILHQFSLELKAGELLSVMGPSGCGKTTLLRLIAGILSPESGKITNGFSKTAYVFQEPRLFPWLTVWENIRAVLPDNGKGQEDRISSALEDVGLLQEKDSYPDALSGGMKARVSLARALVYGGDLFLLDEPFAALDTSLRKDLLKKMTTRWKENHSAGILVTHSEEDAKLFSDRILRLDCVRD